MSREYLTNPKYTKEQKYLYSELNALYLRLVDSYIIENNVSEYEARLLAKSSLMKLSVYNNN